MRALNGNPGAPEAEKVITFLNESFGVRLDSSSAIGLKPMSPAASKRLVRRAIRFALDNGKKRVTLVHKGNIMKFTEGAFREWGYELARDEFGDKIVLEKELAEYGNAVPEGKVLLNDRIADSMFQQVLLRPGEYEVLAMPNLNGDYLSDAAGRTGGRPWNGAGRQHWGPLRNFRSHSR